MTQAPTPASTKTNHAQHAQADVHDAPAWRGGPARQRHAQRIAQAAATVRAACDRARRFVQLAAGGAANLAARGFQHRARRRKDDIVGRQAELIDRQLRNRCRDPPAFLGIRRAHFCQHNQALGARVRIRGGKDGHAALAHAAEVCHRSFEFRGVNVGPATDDDVLFATGEVQLPGSEVAEVAGIQPVALEQSGVGRRIPVVAPGRRRAAELNPTLRAFGQLVPRRIDDAHFVSGQRHAARHDTQRVHIVGRGRLRCAVAHECAAIHAIDQGFPSERRERDAEHAFGQTIDGEHRFTPKAVAPEARRKTLHRVRADRLGAVESETPGAEIQAVELRIGQLVQTQLVGEVRRRRHRGPMAVDRPQPTRRLGKESERRQKHQSIADVKTADAGADQAEVVIQRQPRHEGVGTADARRAPHRAHIREQVGSD